MIKQIYKIFLVVFVIFFGCKNEKKQIIQKEIDISIDTIEQELLYIEGKNIWVRDAPKKGKVVAKLNEDDRCVILDTSKIDTIKGQVDYWYKVKCNDTIGWVFGSQTNIKSESSKATQLFLKQNGDKLKCNNIDYKLIYNKKEHYLSSVILFSGTTNLDTLNFLKTTYNGIINPSVRIEDYNFDGLCDFILIDIMNASHGSTDCYFFFYDLETKGFISDRSTPMRSGSIQINKNKKEMIINCSPYDCKGYYKFIDGKKVHTPEPCSDCY